MSAKIIILLDREIDKFVKNQIDLIYKFLEYEGIKGGDINNFCKTLIQNLNTLKKEKERIIGIDEKEKFYEHQRKELRWLDE